MRTLQWQKDPERKAEKKWRSAKLQVQLDIYKEEARRVKRLCRKAKKEFYQSKIEECNNDQKKSSSE